MAKRTTKFSTDWSWSETLLAFQNSPDIRSYCDLKIVVSDGYLLLHKLIIPEMTKTKLLFGSHTTTTASSHVSAWNVTSLKITLPCWTLVQLSKIVLLLYTGDALITKADHVKLKPLLELFELSNSAKLCPLRGQQARRSTRRTIVPSNTGSSDPEERRELLLRRKVRAVRFQSDSTSGGDDGESVFIYGDGSSMVISPMAMDSPAAQTSLESTCFGDESRVEETSFYCNPCSMIFCESSDFLAHTRECAKKRACPSPPPPVKIESHVIKKESFEETNSANNNVSNCGSVNATGPAAPVMGAINLCLICVTYCKDTTELILHCNEKHRLSPAMDYDIGKWECKRCQCPGSSQELFVFLQHVFNCKQEKRKRVSNSKEPTTPVKRRRLSFSPSPISGTGLEEESESAKEHIERAAVTPFPRPPPLLSTVGEDKDKENTPDTLGVTLGPAFSLAPTIPPPSNATASDPVPEKLPTPRTLKWTPVYPEPVKLPQPPPLSKATLVDNTAEQLPSPPTTQVVPPPPSPRVPASKFKIPKLDLNTPIHSSVAAVVKLKMSGTPTTPKRITQNRFASTNKASPFSSLESSQKLIRSPKALAAWNLNNKPNMKSGGKGKAKNGKHDYLGKGVSIQLSSTPSLPVPIAQKAAVRIKQPTTSKTAVVAAKTTKSGSESTSGWLKKKKKASTPANFWKCWRCKQQFNLQKIYMMHDCKFMGALREGTTAITGK